MLSRPCQQSLGEQRAGGGAPEREGDHTRKLRVSSGCGLHTSSPKVPLRKGHSLRRHARATGRAAVHSPGWGPGPCQPEPEALPTTCTCRGGWESQGPELTPQGVCTPLAPSCLTPPWPRSQGGATVLTLGGGGTSGTPGIYKTQQRHSQRQNIPSAQAQVWPGGRAGTGWAGVAALRTGLAKGISAVPSRWAGSWGG